MHDRLSQLASTTTTTSGRAPAKKHKLCMHDAPRQGPAVKYGDADVLEIVFWACTKDIDRTGSRDTKKKKTLYVGGRYIYFLLFFFFDGVFRDLMTFGRQRFLLIYPCRVCRGNGLASPLTFSPRRNVAQGKRVRARLEPFFSRKRWKRGGKLMADDCLLVKKKRIRRRGGSCAPAVSLHPLFHFSSTT